MSKANLQPSAVLSSSTSVRKASRAGGDVGVSKQGWQIGKGFVAAGPHGSTEAGLRLKLLQVFP